VDRIGPPPKNYALACWWLTFHVPIEVEAIEAYSRQAAERARMDYGTFTACVLKWPKPWARMLAKRAARLAYVREHGERPPYHWARLPGDGRSGNVPVLAQKRRLSTLRKLRPDDLSVMR
jgi:hypothetical protein